MEKIKDIAPALASQLEDVYQKELEQALVAKPVVADQSAPSPILPKNMDKSLRNFSIFEIHPTEIARQITLVEYNLYKKIKPWECLGQAWNTEEKEQRAPNILAMIDRFNRVSNWVSTEVLKQSVLKKRIKMICKFIEIAEACLAINNLNGLLEIIAGLSQGHIDRLKQTWAGVGRKYVLSLELMKELVSTTANYKNLRGYLKKVEPPCVPYIGVYLQDLVFVEEGNSDYTLKHNLINFEKRQLLANVIREVTKYQKVPYTFQVVPFLVNYLINLVSYDESTLYKISKVQEVT